MLKSSGVRATIRKQDAQWANVAAFQADSNWKHCSLHKETVHEPNQRLWDREERRKLDMGWRVEGLFKAHGEKLENSISVNRKWKDSIPELLSWARTL